MRGRVDKSMSSHIKDNRFPTPTLKPFRGIEIEFPLLTSRSYNYKEDIFGTYPSDVRYVAKQAKRALVAIINAITSIGAEIVNYDSREGVKPYGLTLELKNGVVDVDVRYKPTLRLIIEIKMYGTGNKDSIQHIAHEILDKLREKGFPK